jgi:hypothetical protein
MRSPDNESLIADRTRALRALVQLQGELGAAITALAPYPWDSVDELVTVTRNDLVRVLRGYLNGELTARDWERWAEALEGRDDIGFDEGSGELIKEFIFESATPEIFEPLTPQLAREWLSRLEVNS